MTATVRCAFGIWAAGCLAGGIFLGGLAGGAEAEAPPRAQAQADKVRQAAGRQKDAQYRRQRLAAITREVQRAKQQRKSTVSREHAVLSDLEEMDRTLTDRRQRLAVIEQSLRRTQAEMTQLEQEEQKIQARVDETRAALKERAVALYQSGRPTPAVWLAGARDAYGIAVRTGLIRRIVQREADLVQSLSQSLTLLDERRGQLTQARAALLDQQQTAASASQAVERERQKKGLLLAGIRRERALYEQTAGELETAATRLRALMQQAPAPARERPLTSALSTRGRGEQGEGGRFSAAKGRLPWPHDGEIAATFGRQWHPRFHVYVDRKGIEILAKAGEPIRVVHGGTVVYADWFKGYGLLVIVDHGDQYYSLYAHAARALVRVGDRVAAGQVIGEVGDTGLTQTGRLYFEIRRQGDPLNPLAWLNKRRGTQEE